MLGLAAREADIVAINFGLQAGAIGASTGPTGSPSATDDKLAVVRAEAGARFAENPSAGVARPLCHPGFQ